MPLKFGKAPEGEEQAAFTQATVVNQNADGSFIVIRVNDYWLTAAYKVTQKLDHSLTNDPAKAYHWQSTENAVQCAMALMKGEGAGKFISVQQMTPVGNSTKVHNHFSGGNQ